MCENTAKCLVFYDWVGPYGSSEWLLTAISFFESLGFSPNKVFTGSDPDTVKEISWEKLREKVNCGKHNKEIIDLYLTEPGFSQLAFGWKVLATYNTFENKTILFCFDTELIKDSNNILDELINNIAKQCESAYGFVYEREFSKGPDFYAYGMSAGLDYDEEDMAEADRIGSWMTERLYDKRHLNGLLRDVYSDNILSYKQAHSIVEGVKLIDWVNKNKYGSIQPLSENLFRWKVPKPHIKDVRKILICSSLLISESF